MSESRFSAELEQQLVELVARAGEAIMEVYRSDFSVDFKSDESPLTQADLAAHAVLAEGLGQLTPEIALLSEEGSVPDFSERQQWQSYWLIDPLDGTKEFVNKNDEFTVNIALIEGNRSVFGIVGVPAQDVIYLGDTQSGRALRIAQGEQSQLAGRAFQDAGALTVVASRNHGGDRLEQYLGSLREAFGEVERTPVGSSLKLCILAEGRADLYPRLGPTSEWDIAAAHAVLAAAGGDLWAAGERELRYNTKDSVLNPEFIAVSDAEFAWHDKLPAVPPLS